MRAMNDCGLSVGKRMLRNEKRLEE